MAIMTNDEISEKVLDLLDCPPGLFVGTFDFDAPDRFNGEGLVAPGTLAAVRLAWRLRQPDPAPLDSIISHICLRYETAMRACGKAGDRSRLVPAQGMSRADLQDNIEGGWRYELHRQTLVAVKACTRVPRRADEYGRDYFIVNRRTGAITRNGTRSVTDDYEHWCTSLLGADAYDLRRAARDLAAFFNVDIPEALGPLYRWALRQSRASTSLDYWPGYLTNWFDYIRQFGLEAPPEAIGSVLADTLTGRADLNTVEAHLREFPSATIDMGPTWGRVLSLVMQRQARPAVPQDDDGLSRGAPT